MMYESESNDTEHFFCGKCKKQYVSKQMWNKHFNSSLVYASTSEDTRRTGQGGKVPNICYKTSDPRVYNKSLQKAVDNYNKELKAVATAKATFAVKRPVLHSQPTPPQPPKRGKYAEATTSTECATDRDSTSSTDPGSSETSISLEQPSFPAVLTGADCTVTANASNQKPLSREDDTAAEILKLTREIHQAVVVKGQQTLQQVHSKTLPKQTKNASNKNKLQDSTFHLHLESLKNAKSMSALLDNTLVSSMFKLVETENMPSSSEENDAELPGAVTENLAQRDVVLPDMDIDINEDEHEETPEITPEDDQSHHVTSSYTLYCIVCTDKAACAHYKKTQAQTGIFKVGDPEYIPEKGKKQVRWFCTLKINLCRHLVKLVHHQRSAIYTVMKADSRDTTKNIDSVCGNMLYFILKTNTAFILYPVLLAALYRSGSQVGNINHSVYACETFLPLLDAELKTASVEWFSKQQSVTVTADIGTILGKEMLVVLLISETDKVVKFAGLDLVSTKEGTYLADKILHILTSKEHLNLDEEEVKRTVFGMAGDGAFCKKNEPFKSQMKALFGDNFKFRWDILHLVNRSHIESLANSKGAFSLNEVMDFIQNHSSEYRTGMAYTKMVIGDVFGFKRPKLKSSTRMANYDYDQVLRFMENSKFFDIPAPILYTATMFLLVCYITRIILQAAQATDVSTSYIDSVFIQAHGKIVQLQAIEMGLRLVNKDKSGQSVAEIVQQYKVPEPEASDERLPVKDYLLNQVCNLVTKKHTDLYAVTEEVERPSRLRAETAFTPESAANMLMKYVDDLWTGVEERLTHFDHDGSTSWSEAPSEGIFSILGYIIEHKPSLSYPNMISLCRVVKEGPPAGTSSASELTKRALANWPDREHGVRFTTNAYMHGLISTTVAKAYNK